MHEDEHVPKKTQNRCGCGSHIMAISKMNNSHIINIVKEKKPLYAMTNANFMVK